MPFRAAVAALLRPPHRPHAATISVTLHRLVVRTMSRVGDPSKAAEGRKEHEAGLKALSTSFMKWKPDYMKAEPHFQAAGRAFKAAGLLESAVESWKLAVKCSEGMSNTSQAIVTLDSIARELTVASSASSCVNATMYKEIASECLSEAGSYAGGKGELGRCSDFKMRAAKMIEAIHPDRASKLYEEACAIFDGDSSQDVYAKEALGRAFGHLVAMNKFASALRTLDKLSKVYHRLDQPHNLHKLILTRIIILIGSGDPVAAQREFDKFMDVATFVASPEAAAAEDLLSAYTAMNVEEVKNIVQRSVFNYLEHPVTKLARSLPASLTTGPTAKPMSPEESASRAVSYAAAPSAGMRALGGAAAELGGSGVAPSDSVAANRTQRDVSSRAALFAKPVAPAPAPRDTYVPAPVPAAGAGKAPAHGAGAEEEFDDEAAFKSLGLDEMAAELEEHHETAISPDVESKPPTKPTSPASHAPTAEAGAEAEAEVEAPAPSAEPQEVPDDDLGLL